MDVVAIFAIIAAVIGIGFLSELVFKKTNIPDVIFLIAVGILLGSVFEWVQPHTLPGIELFTTFTLVFLLFQGALNITITDLLSSVPRALHLTLWTFFISTTVVTAITYATGTGFLLALLLGIMLGGTSSAVVVPLVARLRMNNHTRIVAVLESAITDVLCIVGAVTVIAVIHSGSVEPSAVFNSLLSSFSLAIGIGVVAGLSWIILLHSYGRLVHAYMVTVGAVLATYAVAESVLANGAIAALTFGIMLGNGQFILHKLFNFSKPAKAKYSFSPNTEVVRDVLSPSARVFYSEISFFVKIFFFVYIGLLMDFSNPLVIASALFISIIVFLTRPLAVRFVYGKHIASQDRTYLEILTPKGLAPVVLVQLAVQEGVPGAAGLVSTVLFVVLCTILLTSVLVFLTAQGYFVGFWHRRWLRR